MTIENRTVKAGDKFAGKYKGTEHVVEVVKTKDGLRWRLADGREFASPSSAGGAITGSNVNGYRFFSPVSKAAPKKAKSKAAPSKTSKPRAAKLQMVAA
jgi:hypothetical protein